MAYPNETASILGFMGFDPALFEVVMRDGVISIPVWNITNPATPPTDTEVLAQEKPWAGSVKTEEIYIEQELRSSNILMISDNTLGVPMPRAIIDILEETYLRILLPAARRTITEADTPFWWGMQQLRNNRNTLLSGLQLWLDDPAKTAGDIHTFDVENWSGWAIDRPS